MIDSKNNHSIDFYTKILKLYNTLPVTQKKISDYIVSNLNDIVFNSITEIANKINVSEASLVRYSKNLGYNGFSEFKLALVDYYKSNFSILEKINKTIEDLPRNQFRFSDLIQKEIDSLILTKNSVDNDSFEEIVKEICKANTIFIIGNDLNISVVNDLGLRLSRFKLKTVEASLSARNIFEKLLLITPKDVIVIFDFYRPSVDFTKLLEYIDSKKASIILITDSFVPPMIRLAKMYIYINRNSNEMLNSQVVPMAISNALVSEISKCLGDDVKGALEELGRMKSTLNFNTLEEFSL